MQLVAVGDDERGEVELEGVRYPVDLALIEAPAAGDYLIVHAGYAIERLDRAEADARLALFAELAATYRRELGADVALAAQRRGRGRPDGGGRP
jgi:hydrogenase expression/formation protein HypC